MAFGGTPVFTLSNPSPRGRSHYVHVRGLTLDVGAVFPPNLANPDTGEFTTGVPATDQVGLPELFGKGRGKWTSRDAELLISEFTLLVDPSSPPGFGVPGQVLPSPKAVNGDLIITFYNLGPSPGTSMFYFAFQVPHSLIL